MTKFKYVEPTVADIDMILRRGGQREAAQKAIDGDPSHVAAILRAEGFHIFADLFEQAKLPRRAKHRLPESYAEVRAEVIRHMRNQTRYHGPFARNKRPKYLDWLLAQMADTGNFAELSHDEVNRLRPDVLEALEHGPDNRRR